MSDKTLTPDSRCAKIVWLSFSPYRLSLAMDVRYCHYCRAIPCDWETYGSELVDSLRRLLDTYKKIPHPHNVSKALYQVYYYLKHGRLDPEPSYSIPACINIKLQEGTYM
ncbi:hypothetical protein PHYSODRAFT_301606 [Phytophthora sojae]|uniref:Uncharacterized protein n=1 Tax=Phytophthora sojae (strain P6497) TaxID=1094619 RepID=G4ZNM3_PHYSP|nr:hypothetical protein PHYSODRAFT_301590 [Phytophthora sojae]XP_009528501.1 hypothetical protein PHYSODRAFT_301606 [Phytophthora sojae]EGZ14703.1 hypothetical protein PHYSODRAFT_301590 [Phytophthora sojae]EGZ14752.1 hypothetical protein PHYSODRAFT_301606 [Phytophthora sojae]|eukprot:XP_009528452.1 hypothetical protein PHYSODRAFT_301590 [Phytophthora sojae]